MNPRERLKGLLVERSVRVGDFTLASGARSQYYVDARRTTMTAEGLALTGRLAVEALRSSGWHFSHVGGLTMGADPVAYAIARESYSSATPWDAFSVRKEPKGHGTGQQIEGGLPEDANCVVIEDSMTSGGSALRAIDVLQGSGRKVVGVLTLVDRQEGAAQRLAAAGFPLIALFSGPELLEAARARSSAELDPSS